LGLPEERKRDFERICEHYIEDVIETGRRTQARRGGRLGLSKAMAEHLRDATCCGCLPHGAWAPVSGRVRGNEIRDGCTVIGGGERRAAAFSHWRFGQTSVLPEVLDVAV
jgi:hypothetical protein